MWWMLCLVDCEAVVATSVKVWACVEPHPRLEMWFVAYRGQSWGRRLLVDGDCCCA